MDRGESPKDLWSDESSTARQGNELSGEDRLMERVLAHPNMKAALGRVKRNRGGPGADGMNVDELLPYLGEHWERIKSSLLDGSYNPSPVKRQGIPKSGGGTRELGIPTVLDRCIQQALLQVLQPQFDPTFSDHSYGFRPGRSAHGAIRASQQYVQEGLKVVVDVDLEK
ncbi:MAG: group II intron reverse transcriptase/maturase, partial [bacterium]|nr:group II intron reverse transcriptase/maturase [bacterium]